MSIRFKSVRIARSAGFASGSFPSLDQFGDGLNVVWGANAAGKSTLARAMRSLLWKKARDPELEASATLSTPDGEWSLETNCGELRQTRLRDNQKVDTLWAGDALCDRYWFPLHELLQGNERGEAFVKHILELMHGVDMQKARLIAGFANRFPSANHGETKICKDKKNDLDKEKTAQLNSRDIREQIRELEQRVEARGRLENRLELLKAATAWLERRATLAGLRATQQSLPTQVARLKTTDPERLTELEEDLDTSKKKLQEAQKCLQSTQEKRSRCTVAPERVGDGAFINLLKCLEDRLSEAKNTLAERRREHAAAKAADEEWTAQHAWLCGNPPDGANLEERLAALTTLAGRCETLRCDLATCRKTVENLGSPEVEKSATELDDMRALAGRIEDWLKAYIELAQTPTGMEIGPDQRARLVWSMALMAVLTAAAAILLTPWFALAFLAAPALLWWRLAHRKSDEERMKRQATLENTQHLAEEPLGRLAGTCSPSEWTFETCAALLFRLRLDESNGRATAAANRTRSAAAAKAGNAESAWREWCEDWAAAAVALNLDSEDPRLEGAQFFNFSGPIKEWMKLREAVANAKGALDEAERDSDEIRRGLGSAIPNGEAMDAVALLGASRDLRKRLDTAQELDLVIEKTRGEVAKLEEEVAARQAAIGVFWQERGFEQPDSQSLKDGAAMVDQWNALKAQIAALDAQVGELARNQPGAEEIATRLTKEELEQEKDDVSAELEAIRTDGQTLGILKERHRSLVDGDDLAKALLEHTRAQATLDELRRESVLNRVVAVLADRLQEKSEYECLPEVLQMASTWLGRITTNRYRISANDQGFYAIDAVAGRSLTLDQLSSGTRVHLLFSVRMAFIEAQENALGLKLPVFLDELLATSDDERARAIATAIVEIARDRQVFYFTAQHDEVEKLRHVAGENLTELPLDAQARLHAAQRRPLARIEVDLRMVPEPTDDYHDYGLACQVAGPELWAPISALHAWHLFTHSAELHAWLERGLDHLGQVKAALGHADAELARRLELLERAQSLARIGRCRILSEAVLQEANMGVNTQTVFWQQTLDYVRRGGVTGNALIQAIERKEIRGYQSAAKVTLGEWLRENNYATDAQPLAPDDILNQVHTENPALRVDSDDRIVLERWIRAVAT